MDEVQQTQILFDDVVKWSKNVLDDRTNLTHVDIAELKLYDAGTIKDANFALSKGIVHEVGYRKIPVGVPTWNLI